MTRSIALILAMTLALSACAGGVVVDRTWLTEPYSPGLVGYVVQDGDWYGIVHGQPFTTPASAAAITAAIELPSWARDAKVVTVPGPRTRAAYRLVLTFNPVAIGTVGDEACKPAAVMPVHPASADTTVVAATFCMFETAIAKTVGHGPASASPQDPAFRRLMALTMAALLPPRDAAGNETVGACSNPEC